MTHEEFESLLLSSPAFQSVYLKKYTIVLIYTVSLEITVPTPKMKAYPPTGWTTKMPNYTTDKEYIFTSYGRVRNGVLLPWTNGIGDYWTDPVKISGQYTLSGETNSLISVPIDIYTITKTLEKPLIDKNIEGVPQNWYVDLSSIEFTSGYIWKSTAITTQNIITGTVTYIRRDGVIWGEPKCIGRATDIKKNEDELTLFGGITIFKVQTDKPDKPVGGVYNFTSNKLDVVPDGWSATAELTVEGNQVIWQSTGLILGKNTSIIWMDPVEYITSESLIQGSSTNTMSFLACIFLASDTRPITPTDEEVTFEPPSTLTSLCNWKLTLDATQTENSSKVIWISYRNYLFDYKNDNYVNIRAAGDWTTPEKYLNINLIKEENEETLDYITQELWNSLINDVDDLKGILDDAGELLTTDSVQEITNSYLKLIFNDSSDPATADTLRASMLAMNANLIKAEIVEGSNGEVTNGSLAEMLSKYIKLTVFENVNGTLDYSKINITSADIEMAVSSYFEDDDTITGSVFQMMKDKIAFGLYEGKVTGDNVKPGPVFAMYYTEDGEAATSISSNYIILTGETIADAIKAESLTVGSTIGYETVLTGDGLLKIGGNRTIFEPCGYGHIANNLITWGYKKEDNTWFRQTDLNAGNSPSGEFYLEVLGTIKANAGGFGKFDTEGDLNYGWIIGTTENDAYLLGKSTTNDKIILSPSNLRSESLVNQTNTDESGNEFTTSTLKENWRLNKDGTGFFAGGALFFNESYIQISGDINASTFGFTYGGTKVAKFKYFDSLLLSTGDGNSLDEGAGVYIGIRNNMNDLYSDTDDMYNWLPIGNFKPIYTTTTSGVVDLKSVTVYYMGADTDFDTVTTLTLPTPTTFYVQQSANLTSPDTKFYSKAYTNTEGTDNEIPNSTLVNYMCPINKITAIMTYPSTKVENGQTKTINYVSFTERKIYIQLRKKLTESVYTLGSTEFINGNIDSALSSNYDVNNSYYELIYYDAHPDDGWPSTFGGLLDPLLTNFKSKAREALNGANYIYDYVNDGTTGMTLRKLNRNYQIYDKASLCYFIKNQLT